MTHVLAVLNIQGWNQTSGFRNIAGIADRHGPVACLTKGTRLMLAERIMVCIGDLEDLYAESGQTLRGSFSAVSKANFQRFLKKILGIENGAKECIV